jgi:hypothetical protein
MDFLAKLFALKIDFRSKSAALDTGTALEQ